MPLFKKMWKEKNINFLYQFNLNNFLFVSEKRIKIPKNIFQKIKKCKYYSLLVQ